MARTQEFTGKTALVTGAGTGIGRAIACEFASAGAYVVLTGRRADKLKETSKLIGQAGGKSLVAPADLNDEGAVRTLVDAARGISGRIDVLVNSAGITAVAEAAVESLQQNLAVLETNLHSLLRIISLALPHIPDGGRIINIASLLSTHPKPRSVAYSASKHGVIGLTKALAIDLAPRKITVNAICPGWVDTEMSRQVMAVFAREQGVSVERMMQQMAAAMPLGRMIDPQEVAGVARFLSSESAAMITGQSVTICGGSSLV